MVVRLKDNGATKYKHIKVGDLFVHNGNVYLKTNIIDGKDDYYSVEVVNGYKESFGRETNVFMAEGELTVTIGGEA